MGTTAAGLGAVASGWGMPTGDGSKARRYHVCLARTVCEADPDLLNVVRAAGITDIWQAGFLYGHWFDTPEKLREGRRQVEAAGMRWHTLTVPLGHPGDALGDQSGETPTSPPRHWRMAAGVDGTRHSGTSLHPPATRENVAAVKRLAALDPDIIFLDDDFRLARSPGMIGGCFCDWHRDRFLEKTGFAPGRWATLKEDVKQRRLSRTLRAWVAFTCDELTACFRAQQNAVPGVQMGNMIMFFGSEKAGIRLTDYRGVPVRVGELMFNDRSFGPVKGKTDELFSVLFHRRFFPADQSYSETMAFPADQLSAPNMAAKLVISTICDVRNTMYMSGLTPFPKTHWATLGPAMAEQARLHARLAGHTPRGPFRHYWGEAQRCVGDDRPFSLFLASGMPFEVTESLPEDGWTFLSDFDARDMAEGRLKPGGGHLVARDSAPRAKALTPVAENLAALYALKHEAVTAGYKGPYVVDDKPVVCAWYPTAGAVLLWNLSEQRETFGLRVDQERTVPVEAEALGTVLVDLPSRKG